MTTPDLPIRYSFDVRFVDLDALGHINNAVYLSYLEQLRVKWFKESGIFDAFNNPKSPMPLILARSEIDYISQGYYREKITCAAGISRIGGKSFDIDYEISSNDGNKNICLARAKSVLVWFNYNSNQSETIPMSARDVMARYLKKSK